MSVLNKRDLPKADKHVANNDPLPLPCVIRYYDDGFRHGILFHRGRDFVQFVVMNSGVKNTPDVNGDDTYGSTSSGIRIAKRLKSNERDFKLQDYDVKRASTKFIDAGSRLGITKSARIVLESIVDGSFSSAGIVNVKPKRTGERTMSKKTDDRLIKADVTEYKATETAAGNKSMDSGDEVAKDLRGRELDDVYGIAARKLGVSASSLKKQYGHLNVGMQRMNLGNRMRASGKPKKAKKSKKVDK